MERWRGKVAIVTGASAGIGAGVAEALVKEGLKVVGLARRKDRVEDLAKKLAGAPGKLYAVQTDVSKEEDILAAFKWVKENLGPVSILVNNAGVIKPTNFSNGNTQMWRDVLETNVLGLCIATREAIKDMQANNTEGYIIHMNSVFGHKVPPIPYFNMYPVSKFAMTALAETLRMELNTFKNKIRISSISPGGTATDILETSGPNELKELKAFVKDVPVIYPADVAEAVLYVLGTPSHVQIQDIIMKPVGEAY